MERERGREKTLEPLKELRLDDMDHDMNIMNKNNNKDGDERRDYIKRKPG